MSRRVILALALACLAPAGCSSPKPAAKYRIAVIPKGLSHEFWQSIHRGAERGAADLRAQGVSVEVLWDGPAKESDAREQIGLIEQMAGMGIQGLVLAPQHSKQMVPPVEEVAKKGIPVVIIDSNLDADDLKRNPDLIVKYVATDNYHGGELAAQHLLEVLAREGKKAPRLVLLRYQPGSESTELRELGFIHYIDNENDKKRKAGQPLIEWVDKDTYTGATVEAAEKEAGALLTRLRGKEPDGIFAVNESGTTGLLNALRSLRLNGKVRVVGFDASEPLLQAVREKDVDGLIVQDPYRMGYLGVWVMVQHLEGHDIRAGGKNLGTGETVVTRDNLDREEIKALSDPAAQARRQVALPEIAKKK
jgi:ribose transport system substrate-binding protein